MCIFRLKVLFELHKIQKDHVPQLLGLDIDGDIFYVYKRRYYRFPGINRIKATKTYFINEMHCEFRRIYYPQQYLTISSKHWVEMIQKDYGLEVTGEIDFYTYNAIMRAYEDDTLEVDEYYRSLGFVRQKDLRKNMHKYYMKKTLSDMKSKDGRE